MNTTNRTQFVVQARPIYLNGERGEWRRVEGIMPSSDSQYLRNAVSHYDQKNTEYRHVAA